MQSTTFRHSERLGLLHHFQKRMAVTVNIAVESFLGDLEHGVASEFALELRVPQQHAERGHGGGEFEVG